jgi:hypothetical protein
LPTVLAIVLLFFYKLFKVAVVYITVPDRVRYVFKAINLGKQNLGVPQLLRKRYTLRSQSISPFTKNAEDSNFFNFLSFCKEKVLPVF